MAVQTQIQVRRGTASSWSSTNPTLAAGEIGFESDTGKIKVGTGSATWNSLTYIGAANAIQYVYTATAGQTTFSGADNNSLTLSYTVGAEQVYVNGVLQVRGTDYTATNGTSVVLTTATIASDIVTIIAYGTFTVADTYTQAQANATFPLNTSAFFAGKNKIINGDFGIWQRGTSFTNLNDAYSADRFKHYITASAPSTYSITQQTFTAGTAPVAGYEGTYFLRQTAPSSGTITEIDIAQVIEDVRTFAGQTITFSFWAKSSANLTLKSLVQQRFGSGGSANVNIGTAQSNSVTTSWQRFSHTMTVPSIAGKTIGSGSGMWVFLFAETIATSQTIDTWGWQLEAGSVATAFQTATGTIQGELAACQRYYWRAYSPSGISNPNMRMGGVGVYSSSTNAYVLLNPPVNMRIPATSVDYSTLALYDGGGDVAVTSVSIQANCSSTQAVLVACAVAAGGTQYRSVQLEANNSTNAYIGLSAEL